ncbi:hypothetical protein HZA39_01310 [Candidatus Peregrinibacteria bacterium]|nr:hypothetical protein [Candidatus Peregrinibacteria bacterium]
MAKTAELHRHHDTSHTPESILRVSKKLDIKPFKNMGLEEIRKMVQAPKGVNFNQWYEYLKKVRLAYVSPQAVAELTRDVILDAAQENIDLLELRVSLLSTVDAVLVHQKGRNFWEVAKEAMERIINVIEETRNVMPTDLLMSISCANKNLPQVDDYAKLILDYAPHVMGIDLTKEQENPPSKYKAAIERMRGTIKFLTIHCMETEKPERGWDALTLNPDRLGHGIRAIEDSKLIEALRDRKIPLEICPLSNITTGIATPQNHPFKKLDEAGLILTINADGLNDGTTLEDNFNFIKRTFGYSSEEMNKFRKNAWKYAFRNRS